MKRLFVVLIAFTLPLFLFSQDELSSPGDYRSEKLINLSPKKKFKLAKKLEKQGSYYNAIIYYEEVFEALPTKTEALYKLAYLNYLMRDYAMAERWYNTLLETTEDEFEDARYYYALCLKYNMKYDEAVQNFENFSSTYSGDENLKAYAGIEVEGCQLAKDLMASPLRVNIDHLDESINNPYSDFSPHFNGENGLVFGSLRSDTVLTIGKNSDSDYRSKIYTADYADGKWNPAVQLPEPLNIEGYHTGNAVFSPDGNSIYFTRCTEGSNLTMECEIFVSYKNGQSWSEPAKLNETVNEKKSNNTHPTIAVDENGKELLYWSSNREDGTGGYDLWYAEKTGKSEFGEAFNLGKVINTERDEITPYYDSENGLLYFSSNGKKNIGGHDVYRTEGSGASWGLVENGGYPINSSVDDIYFTLDANEKHGFMVSNRPGGFGLKSETCCDDIYKVTIIKELLLKGYVATRTQPKVFIEGADVSFFSKSGDNLAKIANLTTGKDEYFVVPLQPELIYQVNSTKAGYWGSEDVLNVAQIIEEQNIQDTINRVFYLDEIVRIKVKLKKIFYEFDRSSLTREYKKSLDSLNILLVEYPEWTLEIFGHTDALGSDNYNMKLGQRRAQAAADYLMAKGITSDRLILLSRGESEPFYPNLKDNGGDNPIGRANNRRVEFRINTNDKMMEVEIEYLNNERKDTR